MGRSSAASGSDVGLVLLQPSHRLRQRVAPERIAQLLRDHDLEHRGAALALRTRRRLESGPDIGKPFDGHALAAEGACHARPARVLEVHALIAARVEIDMIFLFGAPLPVVEHHDGHADLLARTGQQFVEADAPRTVADIGERRPVGIRHLRAADHRERVAAVAETHGGEHGARRVEAQIGIGDRTDIADVGRDHRVGRHGLLERPQHLARMHVAGVARDLERVGITLVRPGIELALPGLFLGGDPGGALGTIRCRGQRAALEALEQRCRRGARVAMDADRDRLDQAEHARVRVDLNDLGLLRPVVEPVLRQRAEGPKPRAERQDHVRLRDELHRRLRSLIAERAYARACDAGNESLCR